MLTLIAGVLAAPAIWLTAFAIAMLLLFVMAVLEKGFFTFLLTAATGYLIYVRYPGMMTDPTFLIAAAGVYIVGGLLVGRFKWSRFLSSRFEKTIKARDDFLQNKGIPLEVFQSSSREAAKLWMAKLKQDKANSKNSRRAFTATEDVQTEEELQQELEGHERSLLNDYESYLNSHGGAKTNVPQSQMSVANINAAAAPKASDNKGSIVMWIGYWPVYLVWYLIADICKDIGTAIYNAVGGHFQKMSNAKFKQL